MQIYNYPKQNNISFEALNYKNLNGVKIPDSFNITLIDAHKEPIDCFVKSISLNNPRFQDYSVKVIDKSNREIGHCLFDYLDYGIFHISTINNYSERLKGVGSALHLTHIISMLENNIQETQLFSLGSATSFHAKLGFKSNIQSISEIKKFLIDEIAIKHSNSKKFSEVVKKVNNWFINSRLEENEKIKNGNEIIDEFIKIINENNLKYGVDYYTTTGIQMNLQRNDVIKNKLYYNDLFNKYKIDYQIID